MSHLVGEELPAGATRWPSKRAHVKRIPLLTVVTLGATVLGTATRLLGDGPLDALRRDPAALDHGEIWRLVSPVLVQTDERLINVVLVFAACAAVGAFAECGTAVTADLSVDEGADAVIAAAGEEAIAAEVLRLVTDARSGGRVVVMDEGEPTWTLAGTPAME